MARALRQAGRVMGVGAGAVALLGLSYMGVTWYRYGKVARNRRRDPMVDRFLPKYEVREVHETEVDAPAQTTYATAQELDLHRSTIVRAIFTGRELLMGAEHSKRDHPPGLLAEVTALGWRVLAEEPGSELVVGAVTQPWTHDVEFRGLEPDEFAAFADPGYAKIIWTLGAEPQGPSRSVFRTETRVATTDPESRKRFRRYWSVFSPGILLIRYEMLRLVRTEAERRSREQPQGGDLLLATPQ
ncbi:MAG TPA: hypothetical protein VFS51_09010 [Gemmatimonadales bacterium]|nr:hypothetical protein [Gemmatimonadales bacterium]